MAKKKNIPAVAIGVIEPYISTRFDNNPDGPSNLPDFSLDGTRYPKGKMSFVDNVAKGESGKRPDVLVQTADGCASTEGQNPGQQSNWSPSDYWATSKKWDGNLSGM